MHLHQHRFRHHWRRRFAFGVIGRRHTGEVLATGVRAPFALPGAVVVLERLDLGRLDDVHLLHLDPRALGRDHLREFVTERQTEQRRRRRDDQEHQQEDEHPCVPAWSREPSTWAVASPARIDAHPNRRRQHRTQNEGSGASRDPGDDAAAEEEHNQRGGLPPVDGLEAAVRPQPGAPQCRNHPAGNGNAPQAHRKDPEQQQQRSKQSLDENVTHDRPLNGGVAEGDHVEAGGRLFIGAVQGNPFEI